MSILKTNTQNLLYRVRQIYAQVTLKITVHHQIIEVKQWFASSVLRRVTIKEQQVGEA